jgi:uncharacterized membrane protein/glutaredoxin
MVRRRRAPWIQRWSRPLIGGVAVIGALNTLYLTWTRLSAQETACPTDGCQQVLGSAYATVFGQPLALFGLLAYIAMAVFALGPLAINSETQKELRQKLEKTTWLLLFLGATAMMIFSAYLMYIMASEFVIPNGWKAMCIYCVVSAILATSMFILTLLGRAWEDFGQLFFTGLIAGALTLVSTLVIYAPIGQPVADAYNIVNGAGEVKFVVTAPSGESELALAKHLKEVGATMYGANWCPHCARQKEAFGVAAAPLINYVECSPDGKDPQVELCIQKLDAATKQLIQEKKILADQKAGYPTWEVKGKFLNGGQSLQELAKASDYKGPVNFKN